MGRQLPSYFPSPREEGEASRVLVEARVAIWVARIRNAFMNNDRQIGCERVICVYED